MANLRDLRLRLRAVQQTLKVTRAMNLISTSKLRKGKQVLADTEPFFTRVQKTMCDVLSGAGHVQSRFLGQAAAPGSAKRSAVIVISSDKGLAGGYNANIFREVNAFCKTLSQPLLVLIGTIGYRYFINTPYLMMENFSFKSRLPDTDDALQIADFIIAQYTWGMFDEVYIVYTHMKNAVKLVPTVKQILPINEAKLQEDIAASGREKRVGLSFEYHPSEEAVFDALVPMYIKGTIYGCLVESYASEQSARMSAMDEATKSAQDMIDSLDLTYNRIRQAGITQEMTEIVSGSSVLS
jgi:F-type H+-transporting ATPase subunit gamma